MKTIIHTVLAALALALAACSQGDAPLPDEAGTAPGISRAMHDVSLRFDITLAPQTDTRAPRPLYSEDAWQKVTDLRIYVFHSPTGDEGTFTWYHPFLRVGESLTQVECFKMPEFDNASPRDDEEYHYLVVNPRLDAGYYRFLVVGRDDDPDTSMMEINWTVGVTKWEDASLALKDGATPDDVSEIFCGFNETGIGDIPTTINVASTGGGFLTSITLRRMVAGVILNVENIPEVITSNFEWSVGSTKIIQLGEEKEIDEVSVVSAGWAGAMTLSSHKLGAVTAAADPCRNSVLARVTVDRDKDMKVKEEDNDYWYYTAPAADRRPHGEKAYLSGNFVLPTRLSGVAYPAAPVFPTITDSKGAVVNSSLYLCVSHRVGENLYPLRLLPIKIVRTTVLGDESYPEADTLIENDGATYNIVGNHLYCLGSFNATKGIDHPIDLKEVLRHPELEITVIGAWQADVDIEM